MKSNKKPKILEGFLYQCQFTLEGEGQDPRKSFGYNLAPTEQVWVLASDLQKALDKVRAVYPAFKPIQCHQAGSWSTSGGMRTKDRLIV